MSIVRMPWENAERMTGMTGRVSASALIWWDQAAPPITIGVISEVRSPRGRRVVLAIVVLVSGRSPRGGLAFVCRRYR